MKNLENVKERLVRTMKEYFSHAQSKHELKSMEEWVLKTSDVQFKIALIRLREEALCK